MVSFGGNMYSAAIPPSFNDVPDLTPSEKLHLETVRKKAQEFDTEEEQKLRKPVEGQLHKYTNVVKGWQFRWFVLTPETGMFEYYMMDEIKKNRPRGGLHLTGSIISPSEDDSHSFIVSAVCGEVYKLKASDAKERQFWVNRLRAVAQHHSRTPIEFSMPANKIHHGLSSSQKDLFSGDRCPRPVHHEKKVPVKPQAGNLPAQGLLPTECLPTLSESLSSIKVCLNKAALNQKDLASTIEGFPIDGPSIKCSDTDLLLLKATSQALVQSLEHCYLILLQRQFAMMHPKGLPPGATVEWTDTTKP